MSQNESQNVQFLLPGILVNHSVKLGSAEARKMTATSGRTSAKLLHKNDPLGAFSKMFMVTCQWASTRCYLTWKPMATPQGHLLFRLVVSMPRTDETEFGLWPTPAARDYKGKSGQGRQERKGHPTDTLPNAVAMWPTPNVTGMCGGTGNWKQLHNKTTPEEARKMGAGNGGKLNPQWVEWLMGYPEGWTG